jgi:hypothetical protein
MFWHRRPEFSYSFSLATAVAREKLYENSGLLCYYFCVSSLRAWMNESTSEPTSTPIKISSIVLKVFFFCIILLPIWIAEQPFH